MKIIITSLITCLLFFAQNAYSIDLQSAKDQGLVGEAPSGYLAAVKPATPEMYALIKNVNSKRKQKYSEIAARNNTKLLAVERLAGKKAIEKTKPGGYIKQGGTWQKK